MYILILLVSTLTVSYGPTSASVDGSVTDVRVIGQYSTLSACQAGLNLGIQIHKHDKLIGHKVIQATCLKVGGKGE